MTPGRWTRDRGAADALGVALLAPAMIGLAVVIVFLGRQVDTRATVQSAAESAAQAAAQERSAGAAVAAAREVTDAMLSDTVSCDEPSVTVDTTEFRPGGRVSVTISCAVPIAGLELIGPPDHGPSSAIAFATIDPLRAADVGTEP